MARGGARTYDDDNVMDIIGMFHFDTDLSKSKIDHFLDGFPENMRYAEEKEEFLGVMVYTLDNGFTNFEKRHLLKALKFIDEILSDEEYEDSFDYSWWPYRQEQLEREEAMIKELFDQ